VRSRRLRHDALVQLIEQAYAAAETPRLWDRFLLSLAASVNATGALLLQHDLAASGAINIGVRVDPAGAALYDRHFNTLDPWAAGVRVLGPGLVATDDMLIGRADLRRTEYFNDFAVRYDATRLLTVVVDPGRGTNSVLTVLRGERDAAFERRDREFVAALVPHVGRALQIHERIRAAQHEHATAIAALDAAPCAVFLVTADAKVVLANRRGSAMLAANDGLSTERSCLQAADRPKTQRLRELCAAVSVSGLGQPRHPGGVVALDGRPSQRLALQVLVAPVSTAEPIEARDSDVTAIVFVSDPSDVRGPSEALLRQSYGLTEAESQVAARITVGWSLAEIAAERGSALATVRHQNKQILAKTGARHRSELVRLLSTTVWTTGGASRSRL
jgi:DNA-binding CsgD family transcriptional regulator/PAS domain-containing protein